MKINRNSKRKINRNCKREMKQKSKETAKEKSNKNQKKQQQKNQKKLQQKNQKKKKITFGTGWWTEPVRKVKSAKQKEKSFRKYLWYRLLLRTGTKGDL
jgi:hypothetical protein